MLCYVCGKNEANWHLSQIVGGKMTKVDLCEACVKEKGVNDSPTNLISKVLKSESKAASDEKKAAAPAATGKTVQCSFCGCTQANFKKTGRLGCARCYETFEAVLRQVFKAMHRGVRHTGKVPRKLRNSQELQDRSRELQDRLNRAVKREQFEEAAVLRDQLKLVHQEIRKLSLPPRSADETD